MRLRRTVMYILVLSIGASLHAQENPVSEAPAVPAIDAGTYSMFERGDGMLSLIVGTSIGLGYYDATKAEFTAGSNLKPGLLLGLSYVMFAGDSWAFGGEIYGMFLTTVRDRSLFTLPIAARATYAIDIDSFIITPTASLGIAVSSLDTKKHVDPYVRFGSGFAWRANNDVSYALNLGFSAIPEFYADTTQNFTGFFLDAGISATYHL